MKHLPESLRWLHRLDFLFPELEIFHHPLTIGQKIIFFLVFSLVFSLAAQLIQVDGFMGFDWVHYFSNLHIPSAYMPWTRYFIQFLTYPVLIGMTLAAFALTAYCRSAHPLSMAASFLCLPLLWVIFLGQIDGLILVGFLWMPWLMPLAMLKPQVALFSFGARRSWLLAFILVLTLTLLIWGNWPAVMFDVNSTFAEGRYPQNIGLGWYGLPFFLATVWFSRGDMDMLMASGAFISPYMMFYNLLPLTPAVARLRPGAALIALLLSFLPLSANWLGDKGWWLGWFFPAWLWLNLAINRYPRWKISQVIKKVNIKQASENSS